MALSGFCTPVLPFLQGGLFGKTMQETVIIDQIHTTLAEVHSLIVPFMRGEASKHPVTKEELRQALLVEKLPTFLDFLNAKLEANGGGDGFFVGSSTTLADIAWADRSRYVALVDSDRVLIARYPKLVALIDRVLGHPAIVDFNARHGEI